MTDKWRVSRDGKVQKARAAMYRIFRKKSPGKGGKPGAGDRKKDERKVKMLLR